jgi:Family of unknown function (DUF6196)
MDVSQETPEQTNSRLLRVMAQAECKAQRRAFAFVEAPVDAFPQQHLADALAFVRDEQVWSALVPSEDATHERFFVFSFHFPAGMDNSGFVGWLASSLKQRLGTGVMVACGSNAQRGGIFDYWGAPLALRSSVIAALQALGAHVQFVES